jgi:hypothetical protein
VAIDLAGVFDADVEALLVVDEDVSNVLLR